MPEAGFTLVQLRYFAAAAELGSMTGAARELMVSQSAMMPPRRSSASSCCCATTRGD